VLELLDRDLVGDETNIAGVLHGVAERIKRRGLVILISDLIDDPAKIAEGLMHFRHDRHEVLVFQVLDDAEMTFPFDRVTQFKDMEGTGQLVAHPRGVRSRYLERLGEFLEQVRTLCHESGVSYSLANTTEPYDQFLAAYLEKRSRLG
jgi:L-lactate utilization protein LutB